jgi:FkbM family methyltransferase
MNRGLSRLLNCAVRGFLKPFGQRRAELVLAQLQPLLLLETRIETAKGNIAIACDSRQALYWKRFFASHEPETIHWIDGFDAGDVLWDIGANVGVYSLYAALSSGVRVLAFEPGAANYHALVRNIFLNRRQDRIEAYCIAFSDRAELNALSLSSGAAGADNHTFANEADSWGNRPQGPLRQAAIAMGVDEFVARFAPPFPTHLKIDVDGAEPLILAGAKATLADPRLKSLAVEFADLETPRSAAMLALIEASGLKRVQTATHRPDWHDLFFSRY